MSAPATLPAVALSFTAYGRPQPAGSKRAFPIRGSGRIAVTDANPRAKVWQAEVRAAAVLAMPADSAAAAGALLDGPLGVNLTFHVARPKGHYGARGLRPSAPVYPTMRPDVLKLARAVEDALTGVVWRDDAQIVKENLRKVYGEPERVEVVVLDLDVRTP